MVNSADIQHLMSALIGGLGCGEGAAETINARWGGTCNKSLISKKRNGHLAWTLTDIIAIEDALDRYPVTRLMARRLQERQKETLSTLAEDAAYAARESGEAIAALISLKEGASDPERQAAKAEIKEAIFSLERCLEDIKPVS